MRFAWPQVFWAMAAVLPLLSWLLVWGWRKKRALVAQWVQARLLPLLALGVSPTRQKLRSILLLTAVTLLLLALARPQWGFAWEEARQKGLDIVVAIDTSRSMLAADVPPSRLARAKLAALDLVRLARADRLALIAFAGTAFLQCPLTLDDEAFRQSVDALNTAIIPQGGTALAEAIRVATSALKEERQNHRVLVLLTDGEDHDEGAAAAAERAAKEGLRIFTMGIGTPAGELLVETDEQGARVYIKDDQGNVVKSRLNEPLLQHIATVANGFYLPMRGAEAVETLYAKGLAPLPKSEFSAKLIRQYYERFQWPLALAILLLVAEALIPDRTRQRKPSTKAPASSALARAALLATALGVSAGAEASTASAQRHYHEGAYDKALKEYQAELQKDPADTRLQYNAGAAAYRNRDFDQAIRRYTAALQAKDVAQQQDAYFNLGNSFYRDGEGDSDPGQKKASWEQAIRHYESALKLNPKDNPARENLEFVRRKIEELQQQQSQQDKSPQSDSKDSKQDQNSDQSKPDQQPRQPENEDSQKQDDSQSQKSNADEDRKPDEPEQAARPDQSQEQQDDQQQANKSESDQQKPQEQQNAQAGSDAPKSGDEESQAGNEAQTGETMVGQMTRQQAEQMLDAQKGEEKTMLFVPKERSRSKARTFKDW